MTLVGVHRAAKLWVLGLAWTEWITSKDPSTGQGESLRLHAGPTAVTGAYTIPVFLTVSEIHKARLAVSASSGPMTILSVSIPAEGSITVENVRDVSHSRKTVTCMKWIPEKGQLAFARLGEMGIWTSEATTVLRIPVESFRGWTSLANPVDIIYRQQTDSIQVLLSDGTFRVVTGASTANPRLLNLAGQSQNPDDGSASESYRLSADLRTPLMNIEKVMAKRKATIPSTLVPIVTGCLRFSEDDGTQTTLIQYERDMLDMKVYNVANLHKTTIFVVKLSEDDLASKMLEHLTQILAHSHAGECRSMRGIRTVRHKQDESQQRRCEHTDHCPLNRSSVTLEGPVSLTPVYPSRSAGRGCRLSGSGYSDQGDEAASRRSCRGLGQRFRRPGQCHSAAHAASQSDG